MFTDKLHAKIILKLMKIFFILFSLFFLVSAANDCCLTEFDEELIEIQTGSHTEHQSSETDSCQDCLCSTFCSYNILLQTERIDIFSPTNIRNIVFLPPNLIQLNSRSSRIFHPPIA